MKLFEEPDNSRAGMNFVYLFLGVVLLLAGRRLYWSFVAAVGFGMGMWVAFRPLGSMGGSEWGWLIGIVGGIVGAILAVLFQKVAVGLAGAVVGVFCGGIIFNWVSIYAAREYRELVVWLGIAVGAILGGILVLSDWGLIVVSSLVGARLVVFDGIGMDAGNGALVFLVAFVVGVVVQGIQLSRAREEKRITQTAEGEKV